MAARPVPDDSSIVSRQLSRRRIRPFRPIRRCPAGYPIVIETTPVSNFQTSGGVEPKPAGIFTTLYWLTCPRLIRHISRLESAGWIKRVESEVSSSPEIRQPLMELHEEYIRRRRRMIGADRMRRLRRSRPAVAQTLDRAGIAGVADFSHIKCLHAHAAFHLVCGSHPVIQSHPEFLTDLADCRDCDRLSAGVSV